MNISYANLNNWQGQTDLMPINHTACSLFIENFYISHVEPRIFTSKLTALNIYRDTLF